MHYLSKSRRRKRRVACRWHAEQAEPALVTTTYNRLVLGHLGYLLVGESQQNNNNNNNNNNFLNPSNKKRKSCAPKRKRVLPLFGKIHPYLKQDYSLSTPCSLLYFIPPGPSAQSIILTVKADLGGGEPVIWLQTPFQILYLVPLLPTSNVQVLQPYQRLLSFIKLLLQHFALIRVSIPFPLNCVFSSILPTPGPTLATANS